MAWPLSRLAVALGMALTLCAVGKAPGAALPPAVRGSRAILLRPEPGPLTVRVHKRDLNIYEGPDGLTAYLLDPTGEALGSIELPDDGSAQKSGAAEQLQSAEMTVTCELPGTYRLAIACGGDLIFGVEASCDRLVVEGDVMLNDGGIAARVWFQPPSGEFKITAQPLHAPGVQTLPLLDADQNTVHAFDLTEPGKDDSFAVPADVGGRDGLWHFDIGKADVKLGIEKVTYWATEWSAHFPVEKTQWVLFPRHGTRYSQPGQPVEFATTLRNRTGRDATFHLEPRPDPRLQCRLAAPDVPVAIARNGQQEVRIVAAPSRDAKAGETLKGFLVAQAADDPEVVSSVGFEVRIGSSPVSRALDLPIVLKRYRHETSQFGYDPDYVTNEVYFDLKNRPFIRERKESLYYSTALTLLTADGWVTRPFLPALQAIYADCRSGYGSSGFLGAKTAFDGDNGAYMILRISEADRSQQNVLLFTPDDGQTYAVTELPEGSYDIEQFTGHNALDIPPPVLVYTPTAEHPATYAAYHDLLLYLPKKQGDRILLGEPIKVSDNCLGSCQHSGGPASTATRDGKTQIVWGEIAEDDAPGVPTHIATYDHASGQLGEKVFIGHAPPVNDVHNVPAVCLDSEGFIHVVTGAHGQALKYRRSLKPNDAYGGWTEPVEVLSAGYADDTTDEDGDGRQTYTSLVCGPDDTLHIAYRQWRRGVDPYHGGENYAALSVQSKPRDGPWGPARPIVVPPVPGYSIYYHKLTIDRRGRLYLSYSYLTADTSYQSDFPDRYHNRALLTSKDGGEHWKLAETKDFVEGIF